jgi:hypothetical protein
LLVGSGFPSIYPANASKRSRLENMSPALHFGPESIQALGERIRSRMDYFQVSRNSEIIGTRRDSDNSRMEMAAVEYVQRAATSQ